MRQRRALLAGVGAQRDVRVEVGLGDADRRRRRMQLRFGSEDVGPAPRQLRGQAHRQLARQSQLRQVELGQRCRGGWHAEDDGERVLGDAQLLTQGRA